DNGKLIRLPGSGGAADIATMAKRCIIIMNHEKRRFTARVRFITSPGVGGGGNLGGEGEVPGGWSKPVIKNMGILLFDAPSHEMILSSRHPGITIEQITNETGWALRVTGDVHETTPPTDEELAAVRKYDPKRVWTA